MSSFLSVPAILLCGLLNQSVQAQLPLGSPAPASGKILIVENPLATKSFSPNSPQVHRMVQEGLNKFTGTTASSSPWRSLITTNDTVGIKVYSSPGKNSGTRLAVVEGVILSLLSHGLKPQQIVVWDRRLVDLRAAGFLQLEDRLGVRVVGAIDAGFDPAVYYETPLLGRLVYGDHEFARRGEGIGRKSFVSKLLTQKVSKIITVSPLLNNNMAGIAGALYGVTLGSVDNVLRFEADPARIASAIPELYALPAIGDKVVLHIMDALISQYAGEESTLLHYSIPLNQLWLSTDPVALDVLGIKELTRQRSFTGQSQLKQNLDIYTNAEILDLGVAETGKIEIDRLMLE